MKQVSLFSAWIDCRDTEPSDGQKILAYTLIENADDVMPMFKKLNFEYGERILCGPKVRVYEKQYVDDGTHRKVALWQPIDALPEAQNI